MYPYVIPGWPYLTTFGVMMVAGFFVGATMTGRSLEPRGFTRDDGFSLAMWGLVGGILGAKLWFVAENVARDGDLMSSLFSRGGLTWFGGFVGGLLFGVIGARKLKIPLATAFNAVAPGLAVGQALGRVGCFLVDFYMCRRIDSFPVKHPVHPTQLYEVVWLLPVAWLLWKRRERSPFLFGEYLIFAGLGRLWIEVYRKNPTLLGPLTNAQLTALGLIAVGLVSWFYFQRRREASA